MDNPSRKSTSLPITQMTVADGNWDTVRDYPIRMVVIHTIVGSVKSADTVFNIPRSQKSVHYGVGQDGKLYQWVDETNVAYQAGKYAVNQYSIGIEHEDNGNYNAPRTDALYAESSKLVADIASFYHIPLDRDHIKKHSEVSDAPTACPDSLDIDRILAGAIALIGTITTPSTETMVVETKDWKEFFVEAGNLEVILPLFGFTTEEAKSQRDLGSKMKDKIVELQTALNTANQNLKVMNSQLPSPLPNPVISTPDISTTTPPASNDSPAQPGVQSQPIPAFSPVQKNWLQSVFSLLFGKLQ